MPTKKKSAPAKAKPAASAKSAKPAAPKLNPIPPGMHTVTPHLICAGASDAIAFYKKAFGAEEITRLPTPDGKLMHAAIRIGDSTVMLYDESPQWGALGPLELKGSPVTIHLCVADADATFARAIKAGATVKLAMTDMFWGDRYGAVIDPFGHHWSIAHRQKELTPAQISEAAAKFCS
jgi:PhnB protein